MYVNIKDLYNGLVSLHYLGATHAEVIIGSPLLWRSHPAGCKKELFSYCLYDRDWESNDG